MPVRVDIPDDLAELINCHKSKYQSLTSFICVAAEQSLDNLLRPISLENDPALENTEYGLNNRTEHSSKGLQLQQPGLPGAPKPQGDAVSSSQENTKLINKSSKNNYSEAFQAFWKLYLKAPRVVSGPTKHKGWAEWKKALSVETADRLIEALRRAIKQQERLIASDEFCSPLPDPFRWLRDRRYEVLLEEEGPSDKPKLKPWQQEIIDNQDHPGCREAIETFKDEWWVKEYCS